MGETSADTARAVAAASRIIDGRSIDAHAGEIMVTAEYTVATVLLALYPDPEKAAAMLNEGLVPGIEQRLSMMATKREGK